ncbi:hypothetical protein TNCT_693041 [Trichonephila clavata]|uniref:Uncharacterized protein n=1 Tax=Trichonephila clavata TaxID=2740835 RepID=A0A8X6H1Q0_TRICU|nr:hypothetical protein TNCT_693041 [Trichonephila clavata]
MTEGPLWTVPIASRRKVVGRERSTESSTHGDGRVSADERFANPPLDLTKDLGWNFRLASRRTVGGSRVLYGIPSTARQRPCDSGTTGPPTHRLDLSEGPWVDRPACQGQVVCRERSTESFNGTATAV